MERWCESPWTTLSSQRDRYKLLIVDDQEQQLKKYTKLFANDFECLTAMSGEAAIDLFHEAAPQVILSDVKMPGGISGFDLCQHIKSISPQTIVILASSYNNTASRIKGYESRADAYLNKRTNDREVYLKVRNLLYTKNNVMADFPTDETDELKSVNSFEEKAKSIISNFYRTPLHLRSREKIDLELVSKTLHKSSRTIQRDFSKEVGSTFSDFHNTVRLEIAADLLISTDQSINEVAEELSFGSPSIFSKSFKLLYKVTPSKYRHDYFQQEEWR